MHGRNFLFDGLDHTLSVLALEHDHHAGDRFSVAQHSSLSRSCANRDVSHILKEHRRALIGHEHDIAQVLRSSGLPASA